MKKDLTKTICSAVALALGVATFVLNLMGKFQIKEAVSLLALGVFCLAAAQLNDR